MINYKNSFKRPQLSLMGVQSGESYLIKIINEYSAYCDYLEKNIRDYEELEGVTI